MRVSGAWLSGYAGWHSGLGGRGLIEMMEVDRALWVLALEADVVLWFRSSCGPSSEHDRPVERCRDFATRI